MHIRDLLELQDSEVQTEKPAMPKVVVPSKIFKNEEAQTRKPVIKDKAIITDASDQEDDAYLSDYSTDSLQHIKIFSSVRTQEEMPINAKEDEDQDTLHSQFTT